MTLVEALDWLEKRPDCAAVNPDRLKVLILNRSGYLMDVSRGARAYAFIEARDLRRIDWAVLTPEQIEEKAAAPAEGA